MTQKRKLLDRVRDVVRLKNYSYRTEKAYVNWVKRYILFHQKRHPEEMGRDEIEAFLTYLAVEGSVAASTQNQALSALLFLYNEVLRKPLDFVEVTWAERSHDNFSRSRCCANADSPTQCQTASS